MQFIKLFISAVVTAGLLDLAWMGVIAGGFYKSKLGTLLRPVRDFNAHHWVSLVLIYVAIAVGVIFFVLPRVSSPGQAALWGAVFGLVVYGLYELTNYSIVVGWPFSIVALDIAWGGVICSVVSMVLFYIKKLE